MVGECSSSVTDSNTTPKCSRIRKKILVGRHDSLHYLALWRYQ